MPDKGEAEEVVLPDQFQKTLGVLYVVWPGRNDVHQRCFILNLIFVFLAVMKNAAGGFFFFCFCFFVVVVVLHLQPKFVTFLTKVKSVECNF